MSKAHSLATVLLFVAASSCAAQDCANFAIGVGAMVDAKNTGVTYAAAKQKIAENKRNNSASNYKGMVAILKLAYEDIGATTTAVKASEIAWNRCNNPNKQSLSDICFLTAIVVGAAAADRDNGTSLASLLSEWAEKKKTSGTMLTLEPLLKLPYEQKNKTPWELQLWQYFACKKLSHNPKLTHLKAAP